MNQHSVKAAFAQGLGLHREGRLDAAAAHYQAALAADPAHGESLLHLGVLRSQQGRAEEAADWLGQAVKQMPASAAAHANLGAALQALGRLEEAIAAHEAAVAADPGLFDAVYGLAGALQAAGRHAEALAGYERGLAHNPGQPEAYYGAGTVLQALGREEEAAGRYREAIALDAEFAEAHHGLGVALQRLERHREALDSFRLALDVDDSYAEAHHGLAVSLLAEHEYEPALAHFERALAHSEDAAELLCRRGDALGLLERHTEAEASFRQALAAEPARAEALAGVAGALAAQQRQAEAVEWFAQAQALEPDNATFQAGLGAALLALERAEEGLRWLEQAVAAQPELASAWHGLGQAREQLGDLAGARDAFAEAVRLAPGRAGHYHGLFNAAKVRPGDPAVAALEALDAEKLNTSEQIARLFALAKAYDDLGEKARGFDCLLEGNALKRRGIAYDEAAALAAPARNRQKFTPAVMRAAASEGEPSPAPIFILGMPRSGSTLVEQILASHPQVLAGGERKDFAKALNQVAGGAETEKLFLSFGNGDLRRLGRAYLDRLPALPPGKTRVTDKMPGNFRLAGLIHLALPGAKIIHTCRDPVDTCLSCFSKLFSDEMGFTYDLAELGRYHRAYQAIMQHWREVLPPGVMLDVQYEAVVADLEGEARRLLDFCGLPWDDACLAFHQTQRTVRTASVAQVRQPIYTSSVGKWRPEEDLLRPLLQALADG